MNCWTMCSRRSKEIWAGNPRFGLNAGNSAGTFGLAGRGVAARKPCPAVHVPGPQVSSMVVVGKILYLAQTYKILEQLELKLFNLFHCEFVTHFPEFRVFKFMYLKRLQYFFALVTLGFYKLCFQGYLNKSTHAISLETGRFFSGTDVLILQGEVGFDGSTIQNRIL